MPIKLISIREDHVSVIWLKQVIGCFPLYQRFRKFRLEFKWKSPFRFLLNGIFGISSGDGPLISVGIFQPRFVVPPYWQTGSLPLLGNSEEKQTVARAIPIGWLALIAKCRSILLGNSHSSLTGRFLIMESTHCLICIDHRTSLSSWRGWKQCFVAFFNS